MKRVLFLLLLALPVLAHADGPVVGINLGANAVSFDAANGSALPSDFEAGGTMSLSLTPHMSAVGSAWYGLGREYIRGTAGARVTSTDVNNPDFNAYLGFGYQGSSDQTLRPQEWTPNAGLGWKPYPKKWPRIIVGGEGGWGLESHQAYAFAAVRYHLSNP
jgi:hypothetical protein